MAAHHTFRKFLTCLAALCIVTGPSAQQLPSPPQQKAAADPAQARKAIQAGQKAEKSGDWKAAFDAYSQAVGYAPRDPEAILKRDAARFVLVQQHMDAGERQLLVGNKAQAQIEFRAAIALDPTYKVATERLAQIDALDFTQHPIREAPLPSPVQVQAQPGKRSFDFRGEVRGAYQEIARQFGVRAQFDPDLRAGAPVRFRVPDVDFETAMTVLAAETHTFWMAYDEHQFFVAEDLPQKRRLYEPVAVRTFVLPASLTDADMTETMRVIREIAGITRTALNTSTREITVRDTPKNIAIAEQLMQQIEQGRGELVLEVELLEIDQDAARNLGIAVPTSSQVVPLTSQEIQQFQQAQSTAQLQALIQSIFGNTAGGGALGGLLPPLIAFGGGNSIFLATLPSAQGNFSQTYSTVHSAERLLLRAQDGQPATFFIGDHFPITLSLLSANVANSLSVLGALPRTDLPADNNPSAVAGASLFGNGRVDLVAANAGTNAVSLFPGMGDGTFAARQDITIGPPTASYVAVAIGDFNEDGNGDIALVDQVNNTVQILFGSAPDSTGNVTFTAAATPLSTGVKPTAILATHFTTSGHLDLAVTNQNDNSVSIFLGDGTGAFPTQQTFPTGAGTGPVSLSAADFDGDGFVDLAVVNQSNSTFSLFFGDGAGNFVARSGNGPLDTGTTPAGIVIGDFNADGKEDIAITNQGTTPGTISVFLGDGTGGFTSRNDFQTGAGPTGILAGDFDGDGLLDFITANSTDNTVTVLLGDGQGNATSRLDVNVGQGPVSLATADLNGDARLDLAVAAPAGNVITTVLNSPSLNNVVNQSAQTPYPGSSYEDIGLKVKAKPRIHPGGDVTLELSFEIRSLSGSAINGIPIISNRTMEQTVRLKENETTLISGVVDRQEMNAITGWPGLAQIPGARTLAGNPNVNTSNTELLIIITPRLLRSVPHPGKSIYAGSDGVGGSGNL